MMVATRSTEECRASEISASEPMAIPTTSLATAMLPLARIEIAATEDFEAGEWAEVAIMSGGLAARPLTASDHPQMQSQLARRSKVCCELLRLKLTFPGCCAARSDALLIRVHSRQELGPGSAVHRCVLHSVRNTRACA